MKTLRHLSLLIILCCAFTISKAQYVTIPDANFVTWLQDSFPTCMNGNQMDTTCAAITTANSIIIESNPVADLTGIEYFDALLGLTCRYTGLQTIPSLPAGLANMDVSGNELTTLPPLPQALYHLNVSSNNLTSIPALPATLLSLTCGGNPLTTLPALSPVLTTLQTSNATLTALPALPATLENLYCASNALSSLPALPPALSILECQDNTITALPALPAGLLALQCGGSLLSGLPSPLPNTLLTLIVTWGNFTTLPALPPNLNILSISRVPLTSVPALPASLSSFQVEFGALTSLPALPASITTINVAHNQLTALPTLPDSLRVLQCPFNQLTTLPAFPSRFNNLICHNNLLTSLPAFNPIMFSVNCNNNPNLHCLPRLTNIGQLEFDSVAVECLPNFGNVNSSKPALSSKLLCDPVNTNGCKVMWSIKGNVYNDINGNCVQQNGEGNLAGIKVSLLKNGSLIQQMLTGPYGVYSFDTDTGNFTTTIDTSDVPFDIICPVSRFDSATITLLDSTAAALNFAMQCKPGFNIGAYGAVMRGQLRPGIINTVIPNAGDAAHFWNQNCNSAAVGGQLVITINGPATYVAPVAGALIPVVNGNTLTYTVTNWAATSLTAFGFTIVPDTTAQAGQQLCFDMAVTPAADNTPADNNFTQCFTLFNSYDPNDKQVSPVNVIDNSVQWLTYTIRFQNTGTAPAIHIFVLDSLDAALDIPSFQLLAYSHLPQVQIFNTERRARFTFGNINLADSLHNEPESHGYIQYRIKTLPGLNCGTQIGNAAHIYFDFNPPVATNAALLNISLAKVTNLQNTICHGEAFNFNGQALTATGNYADTLQAAFACDSIINLQLDVLQAVEVTVDTTILSGTSLVLPSGTTVSAPGNYTDTLQSIFGCDSIIITRLSVISGIENIAGAATMQLYPNPATDMVMINLSDNLTGGSLTLSDVTGRSLNTINITANHNQLNTASLSSGVYLVTAVKGGVRVVQRLVVSR